MYISYEDRIGCVSKYPVTKKKKKRGEEAKI